VGGVYVSPTDVEQTFPVLRRAFIHSFIHSLTHYGLLFVVRPSAYQTLTHTLALKRRVLLWTTVP